MAGGQPPPGWGPMYAPQSASSNAQWAIGLAIASYVACSCFTAVPAIFMARSELGAIERGESPAAGKGLAQAAFWIALSNIVITLLVVAITLLPLLLIGRR